MFTPEETELLTLPYFNVISEDPAMYEIQSKNTKQYWAIIPAKASNGAACYKLMHTYDPAEPYHFQTYCPTILDVILDIINHDDYRLHRRSGYFEEIVKKYA